MYPDITDDMLDTDGAIYYMNGNDSTSFDWYCNGRLCEFYMFHKNECGFIKALVNADNTINVYVYEDGRISPTHSFTEKLETGLNAEDFAKIMNHIADERQLWDKPIDQLDWDVDLKDCDKVA